MRYRKRLVYVLKIQEEACICPHEIQEEACICPHKIQEEACICPHEIQEEACICPHECGGKLERSQDVLLCCSG